MPQPAKQASPEWTDNHESALSGLVGLGINKKEARQFLEALPPGGVDELMRGALSSRTRSQAPPPLIPGGPSGAVPINPQPQAQRAPPAAPVASMLRSFVPQPTPQPTKQPATAQIRPKIDLRSFVPTRPTMPQQPSAAPITPAAAQTQPAPQATPPVKPRIRIRAAGQRIPPAPIGPGAAPSEPEAAAKEKPAPLPIVRSIEEYHQLPPGTEFIWHLDNHIYEKPKEEEGSKAPSAAA